MKIEEILILILIVHWIGDYIVQTDEQAKNKSSKNYFLMEHVLFYTLTWFPVLCFYDNLPLKGIVIFSLVTFIVHYITDYHTSRATKHLFSNGLNHFGFIVMGFDQILHYVQLYLTIKIVFYG